ncbi:MAG: hypothetical protein ACI4WS_02650 [Oscillospiraceae bacterium]
MKKTSICLLVVAGIAALFFTAGHAESQQTRHTTGTVVENGIVITDDGNEWVFECNVQRGTRVSVDFDTCGTKEITDDKIVAVKPILMGKWHKEPVMDYRYV